MGAQLINEEVEVGAVLRDLLALANRAKAIASSDEQSRVDLLRPSDALRIEQQVTGLADLALLEYQNRKQRSRFLDPRLFGEPAWDMLLDLFVQQSRGRMVSTTSLCLASHVPATTALRHIDVLIAAGLVEKQRSQADNRVNFVKLTNEGSLALGRYLRATAKRL